MRALNTKTMDFSTLHPVHGALAGVAVFLVTGKPLPALAVGGGAYFYMQRFGHSLPGSAPATHDLAREIPLMPIGSISHDPMHPTMLVPLGYTS